MVPAVFPADLAQLPALVSACQAHVGDLVIVYALGIHPYALSAHPAAEDDAVLDALEQAVEHGADPRLRAIGECGLHFLPHDGAPMVEPTRQIAVTRRQLALARRLDLPAILHCVRAHGPLLELLDEAPTPPCVLHSFGGSAELVGEYVRRGHYVSFSGSITRPNVRKVLDAVRAVPDDRLLVETDSPDQTPQQERPAVNEPGNIRLVVEAVAALREREPATIAQTTFQNAARVFGLEELIR